MLPTFAGPFDTSGALSGLTFPGLGGFDENTTLRTGVGVFSDFAQSCGVPDTITTTDLSTGTTGSFSVERLGARVVDLVGRRLGSVHYLDGRDGSELR